MFGCPLVNTHTLVHLIKLLFFLKHIPQWCGLVNRKGRVFLEYRAVKVLIWDTPTSPPCASCHIKGELGHREQRLILVCSADNQSCHTRTHTVGFPWLLYCTLNCILNVFFHGDQNYLMFGSNTVVSVIQWISLLAINCQSQFGLGCVVKCADLGNTFVPQWSCFMLWVFFFFCLNERCTLNDVVV